MSHIKSPVEAVTITIPDSSSWHKLNTAELLKKLEEIFEIHYVKRIVLQVGKDVLIDRFLTVDDS